MHQVLKDITTGKDGVLVEPGDTRALAAAIAALARDPERRERLAAGAQRTFSARFSATVHQETLRSLYGSFGVTRGEAHAV